MHIDINEMLDGVTTLCLLSPHFSEHFDTKLSCSQNMVFVSPTLDMKEMMRNVDMLEGHFRQLCHEIINFLGP